MDIYLIRHTQTDTPKGLCYGQSDVKLAENFLDDAQDILKKLNLPLFKGGRRDFIFSSPLSRCTHLADLIGDEVISDARLLEVNFGDWENEPFADIEAEVLTHWTENFVTHSPPNGESFTELCQRVESFWHDVIQLKSERVFIVTHAGVIRALLAVILQLPPANAFQFRVDCGSIHKLRYANNYTYIEFLNL
ncbi:MAG: alpha-ribazole phosphatase [Methylococcales bacterium]|nr:alpha-ribazole phosphatase [Methylococcales bacterium]